MAKNEKGYGREFAPRPVFPCACGDHAFADAGKGWVVLVSPQDAKLLSKRRWSAVLSRPTPRPQADGVYLYRVIMKPRDGKYVDHIDRNAMDNRRSNLRVVTQAENLQNMKVDARNKSGIAGVNRSAGTTLWSAERNKNKKRYRKSGFKTPEDAAAWLVSQGFKNDVRQVRPRKAN